MFYLLIQMFLYMFVALLLGLWLGWMLSKRGYMEEIRQAMGLLPDEDVPAMASGDLEAEYRRLQSDNARITEELARANTERNALQNDLDDCMAARKADSATGSGAATATAAATSAAAAAVSAPTAAATPTIVEAPKVSVSDAVASVDVGTKPEGLSGPRGGKADDLKEIKGIGPKLEEMLHGMGFYHFDQIAGWGPDELAWVDENLEGFKGRASRDEWIKQAKVLA